MRHLTPHPKPCDPLLRPVGIEKIGEVQRQHAGGEPSAVMTHGFAVIARHTAKVRRRRRVGIAPAE